MTTKRMKTLWQKVTGASPLSYDRFDVESEDESDVGINDGSAKDKQQLPKESKSNPFREESVDKDKKKKKKRKGWKRIRHAAIVTCRYIGLGVSHLSPVPEFPGGGDYNIDYAYGLYGNKYYTGKAQPAPHWTTGIILNGW